MAFNPLGFVLPAASLGFGLLLVKPKRGFFSKGGSAPLIKLAQAYLDERHTDETEITEHPVEQGAAIADHAYMRPAMVTIVYGWSNSPTKASGLISQAVGIGSTLAGSGIGGAIASIPATARAAQSVLAGNDPGQAKQVYDSLLKLQSQRTLFDLYTGKRAYKDMLIQSIGCNTDADTENSVVLTITCRQVIIAVTQVVTIGANPAVQAEPESTAAPLERGVLSPTPTDDMFPTEGMLSSSLGELSSNLGGITDTLGNIPTAIAEAIPGAMGQLGNVISDLQTQISSVLAELPLPLEIPAISGIPQGFSLPDLGLESMSSVLSDSLNSLTTGLQTALPSVIDAAQQLPSLVSDIGSSVAAELQTALDQTPDFINNSISRIRDAFLRNP